jgi:hypothetical protein
VPVPALALGLGIRIGSGVLFAWRRGRPDVGASRMLELPRSACDHARGSGSATHTFKRIPPPSVPPAVPYPPAVSQEHPRRPS